MTPRELLKTTLETKMSAEACATYGLVEPDSDWLRAICLAQLKRALQGDSAAFKAILEVAYPDDVDLLDEGTPDPLSAALMELAEEL